MQVDGAAGILVVFFKVPLPQSGNVVAHLRESPGVVSAVAVYSGVDVIAVLDGTRDVIDATYQAILQSGAPIEPDDSYFADGILPGADFGSRQHLAGSACLAFVRCAIRVPEVNVAYATSVLARVPGVVRLFPSATREEVLLEVVTGGKRALDEMVMTTIQGQTSVVKSTRTYLGINSMRWDRDNGRSGTDVFISVAPEDVPYIAELRKRIEDDCAVKCISSQDNPMGVTTRSGAVDAAIDTARCHLFVVSQAALASVECAREFGRADALPVETDICCLVRSDCEIAELPRHYQDRRCMTSDDLFAYPRLLDWLLQRRG